MNDDNSNMDVDIGYDTYAETAENQFLTFEIGGEVYGVDILQVREIKAWSPVTKIPNTSDTVEGVLNLRGEIVPVIDMRSCFKMEKVEYTPFTVVIVLSLRGETGKSRMIGLVADGVSDVVDVSDEELKPTPEFGDDIKTETIRNIATINGKMIMILDIMQLVKQSITESDST